MSLRYFEDEMRYLQEAGAAFAHAHPGHARYLNIDSLADRDPYVERLFEGFAFLTGRIRERLDDEFPQYTENLLRLLHPHFVKPIPSLSILAFRPRPGMLQQTTRVARGTAVDARPVGEEATACRFTTAYDVPLHPIQLTHVDLAWADGVRSSATLRFHLDRGVDYQKLDVERLRLFFYAEPTTASMMHLFFTRHVARVAVRAGTETVTHFGQQWVQPVGFRADEALLPFAPHAFSGYRLLQEYFSFRPKFWFVDVLGLDTITVPPGTTEITVEVHFDRTYPQTHAFKTENIRLYCTPIINLFETDAEPIRVQHRAAEYPVIGDVRRPRTLCVYDIQSVSGIEEATARRHTYQPFFAFQHIDTTDRFFLETARIGPTNQRQTYLSVGGFGDEIARMPVETLTLTVRCTNGDLPREALRERSINQPAPGFPNVASFENLTQPSRALPPPSAEDRRFFWKLVSHQTLNRLSAATTETLTGLLRLYDWSGTDANRRRIEGIRQVQWAPKETFHRGGIIRGAEVTIEVQDDHFADEGDLHLFGSVMNAFFAMYATLNSFVHLTIVSMPSGARFQWQPPHGNQSLV